MREFGLIACFGLTACSNAATKIADDSIVSMTLCADGYLHTFPSLEPRLAALSWQSRSALSVTPIHLRHLPQTDTDLERAQFWNGATRISSAGGTGDIDLKWGEDFESVWENLKTLSNALNEPNPSTDLQLRLAALSKPTTPPKILYLNRSGATAGPGTFVDAVIQSAGGENIVQTAGWQSPDTERLMQFNPDIILTSFSNSSYSSVNDRSNRHAALSAKISSVPQIEIPGQFWPCAGPGLVDAAEHLSKAMTSL